MPRYLLKTHVIATPRIDAAVRLASQRFPEIAVEDVSVDDTGARTLWLCRAPSETHVSRWAEAAQLGSAGPVVFAAVTWHAGNDRPR
jgi:hypothetical protein